LKGELFRFLSNVTHVKSIKLASNSKKQHLGYAFAHAEENESLIQLIKNEYVEIGKIKVNLISNCRSEFKKPTPKVIKA